MFFGAAHFLCVIVTLTAAVVFFTDQSRLASQLLLGGMAASVATWLLSFIKRRGVYCPLCKGTPLVNSGARPHVKARRIPPFNHGTTAMFSLLACQRFRCMYCGENFDLMKPSNRILYGDDTEPSATVHPLAR